MICVTASTFKGLLGGVNTDHLLISLLMNVNYNIIWDNDLVTNCINGQCWQHSGFRYQNTWVQILSSATSIEQLFTVNCLLKRHNKEKEAGNSSFCEQRASKVQVQNWLQSLNELGEMRWWTVMLTRKWDDFFSFRSLLLLSFDPLALFDPFDIIDPKTEISVQTAFLSDLASRYVDDF